MCVCPRKEEANMPSAALTKAKVLVVDDYQGMRTILRDLVRSMGVSRVDTAASDNTTSELSYSISYR